VRRAVLVLYWSASWALGAAVAAGLGCWAAAGDEILLGRYTGYVVPWLALALAPALAVAWAARRRALSLLLAAPLAAIVAIHAPDLAPRRPRAAAGTPLVVLSFNTWSRNHDAARIAGVVRKVRPDLLLLQEIRPRVFAAVLGELRDLYGGEPVHHAYDPDIGQAIVSRFAVEPVASLRHKGKALQAVVCAPSGRLTVFNVHPPSGEGWRVRHDQIAALLEDEVLRQPGPVIVAGDFNVPERSQLYALLARSLASAHDAAGTGLGFTFPTSSLKLLGRVPAFSVVRIDHVFTSRDVVAVRAGTIRDHGGSDHRPVFAELVLPDPTSGGGRRAVPRALQSHVDHE
jgi:vancomycin resistance protein VanJ